MARTNVTHIDGKLLENARKDAGYSATELAARIHVDERTWRRWVKRGAIPTVSLPAVARYLNLELPSDPGTAADRGPSLPEALQAALAELLDGQGEILTRLEAIAVKLDEQAARLPTAQRRRRG